MSPTNPVFVHREKVLKMAREFVPAYRIAKAVGGHERSVSELLKGNGIPTKQSNAAERNKEEVLRLNALGVRSNEIARQIGANDRHVRRLLDDLGVPRNCSFSNPGEQNPAWVGGRIVDKGGYIKLWMPDHPDCNVHGYVLEHRLIMETMIGRRLSRQEVVHHKNKKPADNRPENLQLFSENGLHLAHELKGQCPKWSPEGYERIQKAVALWREGRREHNRKKSERGASSSR